MRAHPPDRSGKVAPISGGKGRPPCLLKHPASDTCAPEATVAQGQPYTVFMHASAAAYSPTLQSSARAVHA